MRVLVTGGAGYIGSHAARASRLGTRWTIDMLPEGAVTVAEQDADGTHIAGKRRLARDTASISNRKIQVAVAVEIPRHDCERAQAGCISRLRGEGAIRLSQKD